MLILVFLGGCAASRDDVLILDNRLRSIEGDLGDQRREAGEFQQKIAGRLDQFSSRLETMEGTRKRQAELKAQMDGLEDRMRKQTGRLDLLEHQAKQRKEAESQEVEGLKKEIKELSARLRQLDDRAAHPKEAKTEPSPPEAKPAGPGSKTTPAAQEGLKGGELFKKAQELYEKGSYEEARTQWEEFLKKEPKGEQSALAQFMIGETYFKERRFEEAILAYQKVIQGRKGKIPEALYRQGLAFMETRDKESARILFNKILKEYSDSPQAALAKKKLKEIKDKKTR
jgi:tol-pal system protein YbgF